MVINNVNFPKKKSQLTIFYSHLEHTHTHKNKQIIKNKIKTHLKKNKTSTTNKLLIQVPQIARVRNFFVQLIPCLKNF
jgi:hypothetical protein